MKFKANRKALLSALQFAGSAVANRTTLPVLNCLLIQCEDSRLTAFGTNLDVWTSAECQCSAEIGAFCAPAELLTRFVQNASGDEVAGELVKKNRLTLRCGSSKAELATMDREEFPAIPKIEGPTVTIADLKARLDSVRRCAHDNPIEMPVLCGVFAEFKDGKLTLMASDGRRAAFTELPSGGDGSYIVPSGLVDRIAREGEVQCTFGTNQARFSGNDWSVFGKLIDGNYPNLRLVVLKGSKQTVSIPRDDLVSAVRRAVPFTTGKASSVKLEFKGKALTISAGDGDRAIEETIEDIEAQPLAIAVNPEYLLSLVAPIKADLVKLQLTDDKAPLIVREGDYLGVMMPLRL